MGGERFYSFMFANSFEIRGRKEEATEVRQLYVVHE